jgi:predicted AAA+ superfamily ATPase
MDMLDTLKSIILEFQQISLKTGILRHLDVETAPGKASVCIGGRACGKSTYLFQVMQQLVDNGIPRENLLYLNFADDRLHTLAQEGIGLVTEAYFSIYPEKQQTERIYCFFDEIQAVELWEPFVDRTLRTETCDLYLTGTSTRMLSREIATQTHSRAAAWELFPLSFKEFLAHRGIASDDTRSMKNRLMVQKAFDEYWEIGGYPGVIDLERHLHIQRHQDCFHAVLDRDVIGRHDASHPRAVTDLAHRLINNTGSPYSVNGLTGYLKSLGHTAPKSAVSNYLEWLEEAFFLYTVRIFDSSAARSKTNPKKIYCVDHALVLAVASGKLVNATHLLENLVFMALRRVSSEIYYYKTKSGQESTFLTLSVDGTRSLVQVCESLADPRIRKQATTALGEAMAELSLDSGTIVTRRDAETVPVEAGKIDVLPAWRFLLDQSR